MSCVSKPWDSIRVKPPVTQQPIGAGSFRFTGGGLVTLTAATPYGVALRIGLSDRTECHMDKGDVSEAVEFFTALRAQMN